MSNSFDRRQFLKLAGTSALGLSFFACSHAPSPAVIVGGARLSGLTAALLLEERGVTVKVLEARDRLGGRVFTLDNVPGIPECGGPVIASSYKRLLKLAELASVPMQPAPGFGPKLSLHVNGKTLDAQAWAGSDAAQLYGSIGFMKPNLRDTLPTVEQLDKLSRQKLLEYFKLAGLGRVPRNASQGLLKGNLAPI